ncbi:MAG: UxaA family hydrolase [Ardenticatenaceae bacterium]|nr:UxaA family hydrolase [Ardenticatenaceae bacterium]
MAGQPFHAVARLPLAGDNAAIAIRRLEAGTAVSLPHGPTITLRHTVLEGHRFAVRPIVAGTAPTSWLVDFGVALHDIAPGDVLTNQATLDELRSRALNISLPDVPNFADRFAPYHLDPATFRPAVPLPRHDEIRTFLGYPRPGGRGTGTRNIIILLGTTVQTAAFVRVLETRLKGAVNGYANIDGVTAVAHTEGGTAQMHNRDLVLRTLAGFMTHPNVGAVLAVDDGRGPLTNARLQTFMAAHNYPLAHVRHAFMTLEGGFEESLVRAAAIVAGWLDEVNGCQRQALPLSALKIALQCGGSDAFSGISGNPLVAEVSKEVIRYGGTAVLAETDELIGAEPYVLQKVRDLATGERFLAQVARFKEWAGWHGVSPEGNPSGGNRLRGLYNIALKSIGAAMKKHPDLPLDYAIDYAEPLGGPGFYFMDSPGNDLESIAGQVAAGCNLIFFVTGNGSITNFPFVPTLKVVTTTPRYELLQGDMDVNAGAYLDGVPLAELAAQMLDLTVATASGQRSVGEQAGHAQVQIWRDWAQNEPVKVVKEKGFDGRPLPIAPLPAPIPFAYPAFRTAAGPASDRMALILPTSLCAGQIGRMAAARFNQLELGRAASISRFVALVHTEGCGSSSNSLEIFDRTLLGYLQHPLVAHALLLEHGCEKTHNAYMRARLAEMGLNPARFGWASIQAEGGIEPVLAHMADWFAAQFAIDAPPETAVAGLAQVRLGLTSAGPVRPAAATMLARLARVIVSAGGRVIVPQQASLWQSPEFATAVGLLGPITPTLAFAQTAVRSGFHVMQTFSGQWTEALTGLGATGVEVVVAYAGERPLPGHPLVPVLTVSAEPAVVERCAADLDLALSADVAPLLDRVQQTLGQAYAPTVRRQQNLSFQIPRGLLGISL